MLNLEVIKILDNITSLLLSIKEKYAILFEIDINNLKDSKEYLEAVKGIKSLKPTVINCIIDTATRTESGHITSLNPKKMN